MEGAFNKFTNNPLNEAEAAAQLTGSFGLFSNESPLEITLESDFRQLVRDKDKEDKYQDALLHYTLNDSIVVKQIIRIKPRGKFRRDNCSKPALKLNFKKTKFYNKDLESLETMKLVYACQRSETAEQYILKEYLIYKIYKILSELSFRTRLIKLIYRDTGRKKASLMKVLLFLLKNKIG